MIKTLVFSLLLLVGTAYASPPTLDDLGWEADGTGYFVTNDGYIVTNGHVVARALTPTSMSVVTRDGIDHPATLVYLSMDVDIAILKIKGSSPCLKIDNHPFSLNESLIALIIDLRNSDNMATSPVVQIVGSILGLRDLDTVKDYPVKYHNAGITQPFSRPGNSGSPLVDPVSHLVIGMVYGGESSPFTKNLYTLVFASTEIQKGIAESGIPIVCSSPTPTLTNDVVLVKVDIHNPYKGQK